MNKPKTHPLSHGHRVALASLAAALFLGGCSFSTSARSNTAANANADNRASSNSGRGSRAEGSAKGSANVSGGSGAHASSKASSKASGKASGKSSGSSKFVFRTKSRVTGMGKAKTEDHFKGAILVGGGGKGKASASGDLKAGGSAHVGGKGRGEAEGSAKAEGKGEAKTGGKGASNAEKASSTKSQSKKPGKDKEKPTKGGAKPTKGGAKPTKEKPTKDKTKPEKGQKPTKDKKPGKDKITPPDKPIVVIDPPEEPPENVFGYETPVRGCFEGIVYPLASQTKNLPTDWNALTGISVVYACEWDIPVRKWDLGFPGVEDRFEWFAIQYAGSFSVETAGKWTFRISSDDGAKLYIDGKLIVDNDGVHPPKEKKVEVNLTAGDHEMVLEYFQGPRYHINLQLFATPPGGEEGVFSVR